MEAKGKEELSKCGGRRKPSWEINAHENGNSRQETKQMTLGATQRMENHWLGGKGQFCFALLSLRFKASGLSIKESVRKRKYSQKKSTVMKGHHGQPLYVGISGQVQLGHFYWCLLQRLFKWITSCSPIHSDGCRMHFSRLDRVTYPFLIRSRRGRLAETPAHMSVSRSLVLFCF